MIKQSKSKLKLEEIQIFNLARQLSNKEDNKAVCIYGKTNQKKSKTINALIRYKKDDEEIVQSFLPLKSANQKNLLSDINFLVEKNLHVENLECLDFKKINFFKNISKKNMITKCANEFSKIKKTVDDKDKYERTSKVTGPILNTISAFGISLGVPLLSLALFRSQEIFNSLSSYFFYSLVSICVVLILMAITTTIYFLTATIINNKKQFIISNLSESLEIFVLKWFEINKDAPNTLTPKHQKQIKKQKRKFKIKTFYNFFYNDVKINSDGYEDIISFFRTLYYFGNNIFFAATFENEFEYKLVTKNYWNEFLISFDISKYKTRHNYNSLILSILNNISKSTHINAKKLFLDDQIFANNIRFFLDKSESNLELLTLFNEIKKYARIQEGFAANNKVIDYFNHLFSMIVFMILEKDLFANIIYELSTTFTCNHLDNVLFKNLRIESILVKNLQMFGNNSILFNAQYIFEEEHFDDICHSIFDDKEEIFDYSYVEKNIIKRGFSADVEFDDEVFNLHYINTFSESLLVKKIELNETTNLFEDIEQIKLEAWAKNAKFICLEFPFKCIFFQKNLDVYEILEDFFS
ncbi:MAG: hypothetical protein RR201_00655 [Malacoplasma sp.]